jgi:hypothetical protein
VAARPARDRVQRHRGPREVAQQLLVHDACARVRGEDACVGGRERDAKERQPEEEQQRGARDGDERSAAHHEAREPVPAVALGAAALPSARREGVHARAEQREHRRQHDERDGAADE